MSQGRRSRVTIGLLGPFGYGNLGDAAIQQSAIDGWRRQVPGAEFIGISLNPRDTEERHGIPSVRIGWLPNPARPDNAVDRLAVVLRRWTVGAWVVRLIIRPMMEVVAWFEAFACVRNLDVLVVSGGGQLDDFWGGAFGHPYALWRWTKAADVGGVPIVFVSVGAGPIDSPVSRRFLRAATGRASYLSFRDVPSRDLMVSVGHSRSDGVFPDLAHGIGIPLRAEREEGIVGFGPMGYADPRMWPKSDAAVYRAYRSTTVEVIRWLVATGRRVLLFPGEADHDRWVIDDLLSELGADERVEAPEIRAIDQLMAALVRTDAVIASRFHGVLLAHAAHRPVLAVSYHQKVASLMEAVGHGEFCLDIRRFVVQDVQDRFQRLWSNRERLSMELREKEEEYRRRLVEQYRHVAAEVRIA